MLADGGAPEPQKQGLFEGLHQARTQFLKLIEFIASHLPKWRDDARRKVTTAEDVLSEHLCDYLNDEARNMPGIESFKFGREPRDEANPKGNLDISAKPVGDWLTVDARHYSLQTPSFQSNASAFPCPNPNEKIGITVNICLTSTSPQAASNDSSWAITVRTIRCVP